MNMKGRSKLRPSRQTASLGNETIKLLVVSAFVLVVFISGVVVGVNFFELHDNHKVGVKPFVYHNSNNLPSGTIYKQEQGSHFEASKLADKAVENPVVDHADVIAKPAIIHSNVNVQHSSNTQNSLRGRCCQDSTSYICLACQNDETELQFCTHHPEVPSCVNVIPSVKVDHSSFLTYDGQLDADRITVSAWIYLDDNVSQGMRTIVSNRMAGCNPPSDRRGFAFFVNSYSTNDGRLILMWANNAEGCVSIETKEQVIQPKQWTHVGFIIDGSASQLKTSLFINGIEMTSTTSDARPLPGSLGAKFRIGAHLFEEAPLNGQIADVIVYHGAYKSVLLWPNKSPPIGVRQGSESIVAAHYKLDKLVSKSVVDQSQHKRHAFLPIQNNVNNIPAVAHEQVGPIKPQHAVTLPTPKKGYDGIILPVPISKLISGEYDDVTDQAIIRKSNEQGRENAKIVREAMKFSYNNYEKFAYGHDELSPKSGKFKDVWGFHAVTLVDSLDTLWIMDLKEEFWRGRDYVRDRLSFDLNRRVSAFETNIRDLGGLLSAYEFSGDKAFLNKAIDLGDRLLRVFETDTGLPMQGVNLRTGAKSNAAWALRSSLLAEFGTMQLEFRNLAFHTGKKHYAEVVEKVYDVIKPIRRDHGLVPIFINPQTLKTTKELYSFGAMGDSYYEYLLKVWIQGRKQEPERLNEYNAAMDGLVDILLKKSTPTGLSYVAEKKGRTLIHKMDHLACFVPGMLALGAYQNPTSPHAARDMQVAKALMYTCWQMYERQATGIAPELVVFVANGDMQVKSPNHFYILRPETVESMFILQQITNHPIYREWGHKIMVNLNKYSRTTYGYGAIPDVRSVSKPPDDRMESFFLAETLKYLYLLQQPDHEIDLTKYVFNTEAHPLRIFPDGWREKMNRGEAQF